MTTTDFAAHLAAAIRRYVREYDIAGRCRIESFEEAGVLTNDVGMVVRLDDPTEFQITIQGGSDEEA